jgi:chemotaxis protein MotB
MNPGTPRSRIGLDRWLISYADFITLMFAFFVVLYAFARTDQRKQEQVSAAIDAGFRSMGGSSETARLSSTEGDSPDALSAAPANRVAVEDVLAVAQVRDDLDRLRRELAQILPSQIASHSVSLEMGRDGLVISLREAGFFDSGSAVPKPEALPTLHEIAAKLGATPYDLRVEGHTDNVPIHNAEFASNWELSAARATHIARLFLEMKTIQPSRVSAAGYAEYHPVAANDTPQGRAVNRRVDLVVLPRVKIDFSAPVSAPPSGPWRKVTDEDSAGSAQ